MSTAAAPTEPAPATVAEALHRLGHAGETPPRPVLRGAAGELISYPVPAPAGRLIWQGVFHAAGTVRRVGPAPSFHGFSESQHLAGPAAEIADGFVEASRAYLESVEALDTRLAALQQRGRTAPLEEVWALGREAARLRTHLGRAVAALVETGRIPGSELPGLAANLPPIAAELGRIQEISRSVEQGLTDLILLRNAEEANRLSETTIQLGRLSNRIAELQNVSNIRMLGLTYIALVIALIGGILLIPNTAATILGTPAAAWVPGLWVDLVLAVLSVVPLVYVLSRRWVRELLRGFSTYEFTAREGMRALPESLPEDAAPATAAPPPGPRPGRP